MNPRRATRTAGMHGNRHRPGRPRSGVISWLAALALVFTLIAATPQALAQPAAPPAPAAPQATTTPSGSPSPSQTAGTGAPTPSNSPTRRPDPEGDRWVQLAVVGGGSLLGAVVMFMVIGGIIRAVNRRRYRR